MADNRLLGAGTMYYNGHEIGKAYMGNGLVWEKQAGGITFLNISFGNTAVVTNYSTSNTATVLYDNGVAVNLSVSVQDSTKLSASISGNIITFNYIDAGGSSITVTDSISGLSVTEYIATISYTTANETADITSVNTNGYNGSEYYNRYGMSFSSNFTNLKYVDKVNAKIKGVSRLKVKLTYSSEYKDDWNLTRGNIVISNYSVNTNKKFTSGTRTHYTYLTLSDYNMLKLAHSFTYNSRTGNWSDSNYCFYGLAWNGNGQGPSAKYWGFQTWEYTPSTSQAPALIQSGTTEQNTVEYTYNTDPTKEYTIGIFCQLDFKSSAAGGPTRAALCHVDFCYVE